MRWADDGIFLLGRPHGESSVIADIFTRKNGRTRGLVKGGRSRRIRPILQTGNGLKVEWRARLDDQLGVYTAELTEATASRVLDDKLSLAGVTALAGLLQILPERDPHPGLFDAARACLDSAGETCFPVSLIWFELRFLNELGFGLNLTTCVATGRTDELAYVSPKSGQAVSRQAGEPYRDRLLALPAFLSRAQGADQPCHADLRSAFAMTGHFLGAHVFAGTGKPIPKAREEFTRLLHQRGE
ncbi:MAG TPA: DNA repair protein RecO [Geobacterales bacterium]|nr:DNA repair protein RecO [Geobacterales bacterium]